MEHRAAHDPPTRARVPSPRDDRGSVTPLVVGMVVCLLALCAGVTAATSAFLARQRLQNACDGAAAAAADAAENGYYGGRIGIPARDAAAAAAQQYLAVRSPRVSVRAELSLGSVTLACTAESAITLGALFAKPTLTQTVRAVGHAVL